MDYVILDLEWSAAFSKKHKKFVNEIIEFGAVKLNEKLEEIDEFSMLVTPQIGKKLDPRVQALTRLSFEELNSADNTFPHALSKFAKFISGCVLMTWSVSDIIELIDNIKYFAPDYNMDFMKYYCDVQLFCETMLGKHDKAKQMALSACCELAGVSYDEAHNHRALEDAKVAAECFKRLYDPDKIADFITATDDEFFKRIAFRSHYVINRNLHESRVGNLRFRCPECGAELQPKGKWTLKNHSFRAPFFCSECQKQLVGTVTYKAKYEGIKVSHHLSEISEKNKSNPQDKTKASAL